MSTDKYYVENDYENAPSGEGAYALKLDRTAICWYHNHYDAMQAASVLNLQTASLRAEIARLQADLAAAQAIIIDAGQQVEALRAENARWAEQLEAIRNAANMAEINQILKNHVSAYTPQWFEQSPAPKQEAPQVGHLALISKFAIGQTVEIIAPDYEGDLGKVVWVVYHEESEDYNEGFLYTLDLGDESTEFHENELTAYTPAQEAQSEAPVTAEDKSFQAHDDATSDGCIMCGNEWKSLNSAGRCSSCESVWNS